MQQLENEILRISVSEHGAELLEIFDKRTQKQRLWSGDAAYWGRVSPVLFPIVGRLIEDRYYYQEQEYTLSQHGFLRDQEFILTKSEPDQLWFAFTANEQTKTIYPFDFKIAIGYILKKKTVQVRWHVTNLDDQTMYYSIGAHPAFQMEEDQHYKLVFENRTKKVKQYFLDGAYVAESKRIKIKDVPVKAKLFRNNALIFDHIDQIKLISPGSKLTVTFTNFKYVGVWSPYKDGKIAPFVCIEPWMGIADYKGFKNDISQKKGIQSLSPNGSDKYHYSIQINK